MNSADGTFIMWLDHHILISVKYVFIRYARFVIVIFM